VQLNEFSFEVKGTFELGLLGSGNLLNIAVDPDTEGIEKAIITRNDWSSLEWYFVYPSR
jgi:hypothetical protein